MTLDERLRVLLVKMLVDGNWPHSSRFVRRMIDGAEPVNHDRVRQIEEAVAAP